jgi:hypothetical protein
LVLRETGAQEPWQTDDADYSASLFHAPPPRRRVSKRVIRMARKQARQEIVERQRLDAILAKVSARGLRGLSWRERRTLRAATEQRRKREMELKDLLQEGEAPSES